ncbi:MAG: ABC transporter ATP-binding protein [Negativicutes bacterium]|nr:ABC transporter ATP-binding protein [Negativicutes bacterium]
MISVFKKIWDYSGKEQPKIRKSILLGFIQAILNALILSAIFVTMNALIEGAHTQHIIMSGGLMLVSVVGRIVMQTYSQLQRVHAGYFMVAEKRIQIGDKLKRVPMGYFNRNSLGNITAVSTTILSDLETTAPIVLVLTLGGFMNAVVFAAAILLFDWRIGLIVILGMIVFLAVITGMERKSRKDAPLRQAAQETLVETVLETVQGMSVVKSFNLADERDKKVDLAIDQSCLKNTAMEKAMTPFLVLQQLVLHVFSVGIMVASIYFYVTGTMQLVYCLMMLIASFLVFEQLRAAGSGMATLRLTETSINRANELEDVPAMAEGSRATAPRSYDIRFDNVHFAYENRPILAGVSFTIPEKTTTAVVGPSGSGKTTLCNLIARFWDVNQGVISIDGCDVREYTLDNLLRNISMVFQNVYLFNDSVANNIRFGKPDATMDEVIAAAQKACCHDFIMEFPNGYDTMIGEGGTTLSGGEKQRISIARAMLKDAPIVIFDEATANVDPESEDRLQAAIEALTHDKTIIVIAHRLKTVRSADQILVIDDGQIAQRGTHDELAASDGIYRNFLHIREQAASWQLTK